MIPQFITFEGIDGSGKSTQIKKLAAVLEAAGQSVVQTRDPGGTELGQAFRQILLHHDGPLSERTELYLYLADRAQHVDSLIRPALSRGDIVLCDRFMDSTVAYQGGGRGLDIAMIEKLNDLAIDGLLPDKTILLDGPADVLLARAHQRAAKPGVTDRFETLDLSFYNRVAQTYRDLAQRHSERFIVLDATQDVEAIHQGLLKLLGLNGAFSESPVS